MEWVGRRKPVVAFGFAFGLLIAISLGSYRTLTKLRQANAWVDHTRQVKNSLNLVVLQLTEAETGQRGYLLTQNRRYLDQYQVVARQIALELEKLRQLTTDNPLQQRRIDNLQPLVDAKLSEMQETINLRQTKGYEAARSIVLSERGKLLFDSIKQITNDMEATEDSLLAQRTVREQQIAQVTTIIILLGSVLAAILVALAAFTLNRDIGKRLQVEEELRNLNDQLEERVKQRTEQLESVNRAKDEFLSILSHELRTPLNAILGWARLLRSNRLPASKAEEALDVIERNAKSQAQLIEDILDISRVIQGKLRLNVRSIQPIEAVEAAIDAVRPAAEARSIRLQTTLDPAAGPISGDPDRLQQVVWNLLSNAIKFTPKGGRVQLRLERVNSHIEITVSDTGRGISADFLPYVFDRFRQSDSSSTRTQGGLGLGLAIVRQLVELHGGDVRASSPGEGQGATFTVILPLMILHQPIRSLEWVHPVAGGSIPFTPSLSLSGLMILVVDDEPDARALLAALLEQEGATVRTADSVRAAIQEIEQQIPDVLVSDIGMPDEDGYSLIQQLRALPPDQGGTIPAVAITAYARVEDRIRALSAGFQIHVPKPIEPAELVTVIANLTGRTG